MRRLFTLAAIAVLYALPATAAPTASEILAANKAASGGAAWDSKATLKTSSDYSGQGMTGKTHSLTDIPSGHYADDFAIGPMSGANGFDGKDGWAKDPSGAVTVQAGGDQRKLAVNEAYRRSNAWWQPDFGGAEVSYEGTKTDAGNTYDVLKVTPKEGKEFNAWFDTKTHLLTRIVEVQSGNTITTTLSDYKSFDGAMMPIKVTIDDGNGAKYIQYITLTDAKFVGKEDNSAYSPPKVDLNDFQIAGGAKEITFPIQIVNNHIFGTVTVNGKGPFTFIFDTGGHNLITPETAKKLNVKMEGTMPGQGVGNKVEDIGITKLETVEIAKSVTLDKQTFFVLDFAGDGTEGFPMEGMIGFEGFRRFVTQIDYSAGKMTLMLPSAFDPKEAGTPIPFEMNGQIPQVKGSFEGIPGLFDIDTGARDEITLTAPFAKKEDLRAKHPKGVEAVDGWGVGGPARGYVTRGGELMLGDVKVPSTVASLSLQEKGSFSDASYAANVGGGILKRFIVTFDYEHRIMYLKPATGPVSDIGTFDRSGMWVNGVKGGGYKIMDVTKGGAAEAAGLKVGEVITSVEGKPATTPVYAIRKAWRNEPAGTVVELGVGSGKDARKVKLVLSDQI
ncbi:MAG TPA: aspartyl protease family protein [Rhizomicrobium sp.]|nr:aspartyl protease family protein [Rhizomicrobium sp.]